MPVVSPEKEYATDVVPIVTFTVVVLVPSVMVNRPFVALVKLTTPVVLYVLVPGTHCGGSVRLRPTVTDPEPEPEQACGALIVVLDVNVPNTAMIV